MTKAQEFDNWMRKIKSVHYHKNEEKKDFVKGNIDKYLWRNKGQDKSDFEKICAYVEWGKKNVDWE